MMQEKKQPLLSICIPTYNGGDRLKIVLSAIVNALQNFTDIEVIVSDNCSIDNTAIVLSEFSTHPEFKIYRNNENLGYNRNLFLLVDKYATGKYCWIIGDDDVIDSDSLYHIRSILLSTNYDYLALNHRDSKLSNLKHIDNRANIQFIEGSFAKLIDKNAKASNILGTFMSGSIFLRKSVNLFNKDIFSNNSSDNYYSMFPVGYLMCTLFGNKKCGLIANPLFTAIVYEKSWSEKVDIICFRYLPELYRYYISIGMNPKDIRLNKTLIEESISIRVLYLMKKYRFKEIPIKLFCQSIFRYGTYSFILKKLFYIENKIK